MPTFDLYGFTSNDIEDIANNLEIGIGLKWIARDSLYIGQYYSADFQEKEYALQHNYNADEAEWMEPKHRDYPVLLYVTSELLEDDALMADYSTFGAVLLSHKMREES